LRPIIAEFNAAYPQYKAVAEYYSGSYDALKQDTSSKASPLATIRTLVQCYPDHVAEYINYGKGVEPRYLHRYDAEIGLSAADKADYVTAFISKKARQYSSLRHLSRFRTAKSTELMFWNKGVLNGLILNFRPRHQ
jgi:ABC-type glycerol-3-phosphate transport system substrate-binding protein